MPEDPFIEAADLASVAPARLFDVRPRAAHEDGHPPGAVPVAVAAWAKAAKDPATGLDNTRHWQDAIRALGLKTGETALVMDDGAMAEAARVWFILQYFGASARIVNGGWPAVAAASPALPHQAPADAPPFAARPGAGPVGLVDRAAVKAALGTATQILDTRTEAEFDGQNPYDNPRVGRLPGARLLPHGRLVGPRGVLPAAALAPIFAAAGLRPGEAAITHCQGGGRAALVAAAALRAGHDAVRVYYLSFADWAADETCPIERP